MLWTDRELTAWLDELLPAERMAAFENQLRQDGTLRARLAVLIRHRDQGGNTIGEIWQRARLSCPVRTELGAYLLGLWGMPLSVVEAVALHHCETKIGRAHV